MYGHTGRFHSSTDDLLGLMSRSRTEENTMHTWGTVSDLVSSKETDPKTAQTNSVTVRRAIRGLLQNSLQCQSKIPMQIQTSG